MDGIAQRIDRPIDVGGCEIPLLGRRLRLPEDHRQREQGKHDASGDLESGEIDLHGLEQRLAGHDEEQQNNERSDCRSSAAVRRAAAALMPAVMARNTGSVPIGSITTHKVIRSVMSCWLIAAVLSREPD